MTAICAITGGTADRETARKMLDRMEHRGEYKAFYVDKDIVIGWQGHKKTEDISNEAKALDTKVSWVKGTLEATRSSLGYNPLYYSAVSGGYAVATEVKALLEHPEISDAKELDIESFKLFVNMRYLPYDKTMFKGIHKVPSGYKVTMREGKHTLENQHEPKYFPDNTMGSPAKRIQQIIENTMKNIGDNIGIYISGGVDSSVITAIASQYCKEKGEEIRTFCMGFGEEQDEIQDANFVAEHFSTNHRALIVETSILKDYPKMIYYADMPKRNLWGWYLSEMASKYVDSVLTGLGPDELFGGYVWKYKICDQVTQARSGKAGPDSVSVHAKWLLNYQTLHGDLEDDYVLDYLRKLAAMDNDAMLYAQMQVQDEPVTRPIWGVRADAPISISQYFEPYFEGFDLLRGTMLADMWRKMVDDFNYVDNYMVSAHGLTAQNPILSPEMIELGFKVPPKLKYKGDEGKIPWKEAVRKYVPARVIEKKKTGFGTDAYTAFIRKIRDDAKTRLPDGWAVKLGLVRKDYINKILSHTPTRKLIRQYCTIWNLWCFEIWYDIYMAKGEVECPTSTTSG